MSKSIFEVPKNWIPNYQYLKPACKQVFPVCLLFVALFYAKTPNQSHHQEYDPMLFSQAKKNIGLNLGCNLNFSDCQDLTHVVRGFFTETSAISSWLSFLLFSSRTTAKGARFTFIWYNQPSSIYFWNTL